MFSHHNIIILDDRHIEMCLRMAHVRSKLYGLKLVFMSAIETRGLEVIAGGFSGIIPGTGTTMLNQWSGAPPGGRTGAGKAHQ